MQSQPPIVAALAKAVYRHDPANEMVPAHLHWFHQLDVIISGGWEARVEGRRPVHLKSGDGFLTPPLVRHEYRSSHPVCHAVFKFIIAPRYWTWFGAVPHRKRLTPHLVSAIAEWGEHQSPQPCFRDQQAVALATLCLVQMAPPEPDGGGTNRSLDSFRQILLPMLEKISSEPYCNWSIADLAGQAHLSRIHFSRSFHRLLNMTPKQFVTAARMRAAASELLNEPQRPIKEIGLRARYQSVHTFTRAFTDFFGISPAAYRSGRRGG